MNGRIIPDTHELPELKTKWTEEDKKELKERDWFVKQGFAFDNWALSLWDRKSGEERLYHRKSDDTYIDVVSGAVENGEMRVEETDNAIVYIEEREVEREGEVQDIERPVAKILKWRLAVTQLPPSKLQKGVEEPSRDDMRLFNEYNKNA